MQLTHTLPRSSAANTRAIGITGDRQNAAGLSAASRHRLVTEFAALADAIPTTRRIEIHRTVAHALSKQRSATERMNEALAMAKQRLVEPSTATAIPPDVHQAIVSPVAVKQISLVNSYGQNPSCSQRTMRVFLTRLLVERKRVFEALSAARATRGIEIWRGFSGSRQEAVELGEDSRIEQINPSRMKRVVRLNTDITILEEHLNAVGSMCRFMRAFCTRDVTLRLKHPFRLLNALGLYRLPFKGVCKRCGLVRFVWNVADRIKDVPLVWWRTRSPDRTPNPLTWLPRLPAKLGLFGQFGGAIAIPPIAQLGLWGLIDRGERCPETGRRTKTLEGGVAFDMSIPLRVSLGCMPKRWYKNRKQVDPTRREDVGTYGTGAPFFDVAQDAFIGTKAEVFVAGYFYISIFRRPDGSSGINIGVLPKNLADIPGVGTLLSTLAESYGIPGEWQRVLAELPFDSPDADEIGAALQLVFKPWFGLCVRHPVLARPLHPPIALLQGAFAFLGMGWRLCTSMARISSHAIVGRPAGLSQHGKLVTPTTETTRQGLSRAFKPFKSEWYDWAVRGLRDLWDTEPEPEPKLELKTPTPGATALAPRWQHWLLPARLIGTGALVGTLLTVSVGALSRPSIKTIYPLTLTSEKSPSRAAFNSTQLIPVSAAPDRHRVAHVERSTGTERTKAINSDPGETVSTLLDRADADLAALRLMMPSGDNAWERFNRVLHLDPDNSRARQGLITIFTRYMELAKRAEADGFSRRADGYLRRAKDVLFGAATRTASK